MLVIKTISRVLVTPWAFRARLRQVTCACPIDVDIASDRSWPL